MQFRPSITEADDLARRRRKTRDYDTFQKGRNKRYRFAVTGFRYDSDTGAWVVFRDHDDAIFMTAKHRVLGTPDILLRVYNVDLEIWSIAAAAEELKRVT